MDEWKLPESRLPEALQEEEEAFTRLLKKRLRRSFWELGLAVGAALLVILAAGLFWLPRLFGRFFYNPAEETGGRPALEKDLELYAELFRPELYGSALSVQSLGFGEYGIRLKTPGRQVYQAFYVRNGLVMVEGPCPAGREAGQAVCFILERPQPFSALWEAWQQALAEEGAGRGAEKASLWCGTAGPREAPPEGSVGPGAFLLLPPEAGAAEAEAFLRLRILSLLNALSARRSFRALVADERAEKALAEGLSQEGGPLWVAAFFVRGDEALRERMQALTGARPSGGGLP